MLCGNVKISKIRKMRQAWGPERKWTKGPLPCSTAQLFLRPALDPPLPQRQQRPAAAGIPRSGSSLCARADSARSGLEGRGECLASTTASASPGAVRTSDFFQNENGLNDNVQHRHPTIFVQQSPAVLVGDLQDTALLPRERSDARPTWRAARFGATRTRATRPSTSASKGSASTRSNASLPLLVIALPRLCRQLAPAQTNESVYRMG